MRKYHILHIKYPQNKQETISKYYNNPINRSRQMWVEILFPVFSLVNLCLKQESKKKFEKIFF